MANNNAPQPLDPNLFAPMPEGQAQASAIGPAKLDPNMFEGSALPSYANGLSPEQPINQSPLGIDERFKLKLGNDPGREAYLKQRFEAVTKDEDGHLLVKDKGFWHRVDAKGFGNADAWTITKGLVRTAAAGATLGAMGGPFNPIAMTLAKKLAEGNPVSKEIASDYADMLPGMTAAAGVTAAGVVAAPAIGGAAMAAGMASPAWAAGPAAYAAGSAVEAGAVGVAAGAVEAARSSLGRLAGTYQATNEEQIKDVAFESILNMAGVGIMAGVKPGASYMADKALRPLGNVLKNASAKSVEVLKNSYGKWAGVRPESFDQIAANNGQVIETMKNASTATRTGEAYVDHITMRSINEAKSAAQIAPEALSDLYKGLSGQIKASVSDGFQADLQGVTSSIFKQGVEDGLIGIRQGGKSLSRVQASELFAKTSGRLPSDAMPFMRSAEDITNSMLQSGDLSGAGIALDKEAYASMSEFFRKAFTLHRTTPGSGKEGFDQLMRFSKILDDTTFKARIHANDSGLVEVANSMAKYHEKVIRDGVLKNLKGEGLETAFTQMQKTYSAMKAEVSPLLAANKRAIKDGDRAYEQVLSKLSSRGGKNVATKEGLGAFITNLEQYGSRHARTLRDVQTRIQINNAAIDFNPLVKPNFAGGGSLAFAAGSALTGNPALAMVAGAGAVATSPRLAMYNAQMANSLWMAKDWLGSLGSGSRQALLSDPAAIDMMVNTVVRSPMFQENVKDRALQAAGFRQQGGQ